MKIRYFAAVAFLLCSQASAQYVPHRLRVDAIKADLTSVKAWRFMVRRRVVR